MTRNADEMVLDSVRRHSCRKHRRRLGRTARMKMLSWLILAGCLAGILAMFCAALFADDDRESEYYGEG